MLTKSVKTLDIETQQIKEMNTKKTKENNNNKMIEIQTKFLLLNEFTTEETKKKCETKIVIH